MPKKLLRPRKEIFKQRLFDIKYIEKRDSNYYRKEKWRKVGDVFVSRNKLTGKFDTWFKLRPEDLKLSKLALRVKAQDRILFKKEQFKKRVKKTFVKDKPKRFRPRPLDLFRTFFRGAVSIINTEDYQDGAIHYVRTVFLDIGIHRYRELVAEFKQDVLQQTGLSLEEWILLSKTTNNIKVLGGWRYKLVRSKLSPVTKKELRDTSRIVDVIEFDIEQV